MNLPDRVRLPIHFEPAGLQSDLTGLVDSDWIEHFVKQNFEGDWSVLPLRARAGATHPVMQIYSDPGATDYVDTPLLDRCPYIRQALAALDFPLQAVRLMRLTPGSVIKEHRDNDLDAEAGSIRLHVPVTTNPGVVFEVNRKRVDMAPGSVWYLRLSDPHRVANTGTADRVHLVIDGAANDWILALLRQAAAGGDAVNA